MRFFRSLDYESFLSYLHSPLPSELCRKVLFDTHVRSKSRSRLLLSAHLPVGAGEGADTCADVPALVRTFVGCAPDVIKVVVGVRSLEAVWRLEAQRSELMVQIFFFFHVWFFEPGIIFPNLIFLHFFFFFELVF